MKEKVEIKEGVIKCVHCGASLSWPHSCRHFAWFVYGNKCFNCALYNSSAECDFVKDISICKRPILTRIMTLQCGSLYFVLAPKKY